VYRFGGWFEAGPAACPTARSCITSADGSDRDGPGVLPDGSLVALLQMVRFEMGPAYCPTARSQRFGGWFDSIRAQRIAQRLARGAPADGSIQGGPGVLPDGSLAALQRVSLSLVHM